MDVLAYDLLEDAIVGRLQPLADQGIEVIPLPESPALVNKAFERPQITVAYKSSDYDDTVTRGLPKHMTTDIIGQNEYAELELIIRTRTMRGAGGAHSLKKSIDLLLIGFRPPGWQRMIPKQYTIIPTPADMQDGVWTYSYTFVTTCIVVEAPIDEVVVLLQSVTFNQNID
jgi:hypothetical protein